MGGARRLFLKVILGRKRYWRIAQALQAYSDQLWDAEKNMRDICTGRVEGKMPHEDDWTSWDWYQENAPKFEALLHELAPKVIQETEDEFLARQW